MKNNSKLKETKISKMVHGGLRQHNGRSEGGSSSDSSSSKYSFSSSSPNRSPCECGHKRKMMSSVELLPEPVAREITRKKENTSYVVPLCNPNNQSTSNIFISSPTQPSTVQPVKNIGQVSNPSHTKMPYPNINIQVDSHVSSEDNIPLSDIMHKKKDGEGEKSTIPSSNVTCLNSLPPHLLTIWKIIESEYVHRESYHKIEKEYQELASELAFTKSQGKELHNKLELSEAKRAEAEKQTSMAMDAVKNLEKSAENLKTYSNTIFDKFIKDASEATSQVISRMK